jgi:hypothetical protein
LSALSARGRVEAAAELQQGKDGLHIILWLFVINLGIAFGAGLYETRIVVPQWLRVGLDGRLTWDAAAAAAANVGLRFWAYVTTGPLTLLTIASWIMAWNAPEPVCRWWLIAAGAALVDRLLTFGYFIPTMIKLMRGDIQPESAAVAKATQWVRMGLIRQVATAIAFLTALQAFGLMYRFGV